MNFDFSPSQYQQHKFSREAKKFVTMNQQEAPPYILSQQLFAAIDELSFQMYTVEEEGSQRWLDMQTARHICYRAKKAVDRFLGLEDVSQALAWQQRQSQITEDVQDDQVEISQPEQCEVLDVAEQPELQQVVFQQPECVHVDAEKSDEQPKEPEPDNSALAEAPEQEQTQAIDSKPEQPQDSVEHLQELAESYNAQAMAFLQQNDQKQGLESLVQRNLVLIQISEREIQENRDVDANEKRIIQLQEFIGNVQAALQRL